MKSNLQSDFLVSKENKTVRVIRQFDAPLDLVWSSWTEQELLDQWWAPRPWKSKTKQMEFREGGRRFYAMVSPEGEKHWSLQQYTSIHPKTHFKMLNAFADEKENPQLPGSEWELEFSEQQGITKVEIIIFNPSLERMEQMLAMGFREGFNSTLDYLRELLSHSFKPNTQA